MSVLQSFPCYRGADRSIKITLPSGTYTADTGLAAALWAGDDTPALAAPAAAWIDATARTLRIDLTAVQTAALEPGTYPVLLSITAGGKLAKVLACLIELRAAPGSATAPSCYGSYGDLLRYAPNLEDLRDRLEDQTGFAEQRGEARKWLEGLAHRHWYGGGRLDVTSVSPLLARDPWLAARLAAGALVVTPEVIRVVSLYALGLIYQPHVGKEGGVAYRELARQYLADAADLARCLTLEIDADGDGFGEYAIDLGTVRVIRG